MATDVISDDGPIIPEEDFREAIAACRQDPELDRYFRFAPSGARLFIGLSFYSTHFGEKTNTAQYRVCLAEIEPALTPNDLKYLIRFERDKDTKKYLRELLAKREAEAAAAAEPLVEKVPDATGKNVKPVEAPERAAPRGKPRPTPIKTQGLGGSVSGLKIVADAEPSASRWPVLPIALTVGTALLFGILFLVHSRVQVGRELERRMRDVGTLQRQIEELRGELARTQSELRAARREVSARESVPARLPERAEEEDGTAGVAVEEPGEAQKAETTQVEDPPADAGVAAKPPAGAASAVRVVFTEGRSIVRKSNGRLIEVPRTFSYTGAGLKKPFWIYDRKLDESKMELEAKLEKQARDAWQALHDEARRQAEAGSDASGI